MYAKSIEVNRLRNDSASIFLLLSMFWFRNCNSILSSFLSCFVGDFTGLKRKATSVSIYVHDHLVAHESFATMV